MSRFTSFFLTAFHCLDLNEDGELSNSEKDLSNYTFRFKYEASDPKCPVRAPEHKEIG
jgi:hypothetical protein